MVRRPAVFFAALLSAAAAMAQSQPAPDEPATPPPAPSFSSRYLPHLSDLFGSDLPELNRPNAIKLTLRPHFGDLVRRDYMRMETGLRWALNDHFELKTDASVYFTHGLKGTAGYGMGRVSGGARYIFSDLPWPSYETSVELSGETPVNHPPLDMTDGYRHVRPSFVVQHLLERNRHLTVYSGMGMDLVKKSSIPGTPGFNQPLHDSVSLTGGGVYDVGQIKWTFSATYATTALLSRPTEHFVYLQPGLLWYVPRRFTFHSKSQFIMGLGARSTWGPDGSDFSLSSRLRVEITLRQFMSGLRSRSPKTGQ